MIELKMDGTETKIAKSKYKIFARLFFVIIGIST